MKLKMLFMGLLLVPCMSQAFIIKLPGKLPGETADTFTISFGYEKDLETDKKVGFTLETKREQLIKRGLEVSPEHKNPLQWIRVKRMGQVAVYRIPEGTSTEDLVDIGVGTSTTIPVTFNRGKLEVGPLKKSPFQQPLSEEESQPQPKEKSKTQLGAEMFQKYDPSAKPVG
jgi:hypothetical protein